MIGTLATYDSDHNGNTAIVGHSITTTGTSLACARATLGKNRGSWFCEHEVIGFGTSAAVGMGNISASLNSGPGSATGSWGYDSAGRLLGDGSVIDAAYGDTYNIGDLIGMLLEFDGSGVASLTFYKNGVSQGAAGSIPADTYYPMASCNRSGGEMGFNFGDSAFDFAQPSGSALWATVPVTQLRPQMTTGRRYGLFSGRVAVTAAHPVVRITQLRPQMATGRRYGSFADRPDAGGGGAPAASWLFFKGGGRRRGR